MFGLKVPDDSDNPETPAYFEIAFSKNPRMCTRRTRAVRRGCFYKVPSCLPARCFAARSFKILSCEIANAFFFVFFQKVPSIYAVGSACANRDPIITSETRIKHRVGGRVVSPVAGRVSGRHDIVAVGFGLVNSRSGVTTS